MPDDNSDDDDGHVQKRKKKSSQNVEKENVADDIISHEQDKEVKAEGG